MPDEKDELQSENEAEKDVEKSSDDDGGKSEKPPVDYKAKADAMYARAKQAEERAKKLEEDNLKYKERMEKLSSASKPSAYEDLEDRVDLRVSGFSKEEVESISAYAKGSGKKLSDAAKDPLIQAGIDALRAKNKGDQAIPPPTQRTKVNEPVEFTKLPQSDQRRVWNERLRKQQTRTASFS